MFCPHLTVGKISLPDFEVHVKDAIGVNSKLPPASIKSSGELIPGCLLVKRLGRMDNGTDSGQRL